VGGAIRHVGMEGHDWKMSVVICSSVDGLGDFA